MARSPWGRILAVLLVVLMGFTGLVLLMPNVQAATWTQDTDTDFNAGTLTGVHVVGTGAPATIELLKDSTDWLNESVTGPTAREGAAMVYDAAHNRVILFGGYSGTYLSDTWAYDPATSTWANRNPTNHPTGRESAGLAYDAFNGTTVLFGGTSSAGFEVDTWEYSYTDNQWYQTTPATSPPAMATATMAYDSVAQRTVLVGMSLVTGQMVTWAYDSSADSWQNRGASFSSPRSGQGLAYFAKLDRTVLFGGSFLTSVYGDTWEYDYGNNTWTMTVASGNGPSARYSMGMGYRSSDSAVWMFGGASGGPMADTWRYFDASGTRLWSNAPGQRSPPARSLLGMTGMASNNKTYIFGGLLASGLWASDTWSLGPAYTGQGTFESQVFDSGGANVDWTTLTYSPTTQPDSAILRFQTAASDGPNGPWSFIGGVSCTATAYYTTSPSAMCAAHDGHRYLKVRAYLLAPDDRYTPSMDWFSIDYTVPASAPFIVLTNPATASFGVARDTPIFIRFSEPMDTASVNVSINPPITTTQTWSESDSAVTLNHASLLQECKAYTVTVTTAKDKSGTLLDNSLNRVPNPFAFSTVCVYPKILSASPGQGAVDVPLNAPILVNFSEDMDQATVAWNVTPSIGLASQWLNGTQELRLTHAANFTQCTYYTVNITGKDLQGLALISGPVPNPWTFQSLCTIPYITAENPFDLSTGNAVTSNIVVTFSEPIQQASLNYSIVPATNLTATWSNGNKTVTLIHAIAWAQCTMVTMEITRALDRDNNNIQAGPVPNPWKFATTCASPFLVFTQPKNGDTGVAQLADITIQFSEPMNPASVNVSSDKGTVFQYNWIGGANNQVLVLNHTLPFPCGVNTITVIGQDVDGNSLVPGLAPNPWGFTPVCPNPYILSTDPANGATGVVLTASVVITFNKPMNVGTVDFVLLPNVTTTRTWTVNNTVLTLTHATPFTQNTDYTVDVTAGTDTGGNPLIPGPAPNPWRFRTAGINPWINSTDPADGAVDVGLGALVTVTFSEPMNNATVNATISPPGIVLTYTWQNNDTVLVLGHLSPFAECTRYTYTVTGSDRQGDPLVPGPVPNPWSFTTVCFNPVITDTNPAQGAVDVPFGQPVWVNFSKPMNPTTVVAAFAPPAGVPAYTWSNGDRTLEIGHAAFAECTVYTVNVTGRDTSGNSLGPGPVPNPWSFTSFCTPPHIVTTVPADLAPNIGTTAQVIVTFSAAMNPGTVTLTFSPPATTNPPTWTLGNTVATWTPNPALAECTNYTATVAGSGANGKPLAPGLVPNPWHFTTVCTVQAPGGLTITRVAPNTIHLAWRAVTGADSYRVYQSQDRLAAWPWVVLATVTTTTYDAVGHLTDNLAHYYIVRAVRTTVESGNSTMAAKIQISAGFNPSAANVYWFSLPYTTQYARASDIATELGPARIDTIAKWNPVTQSPILYIYFRGRWIGTNFAINPGDGLYFGSVSTFSWVVVGTDKPVTLQFQYGGPSVGAQNWIALPYTSSYRTASDIVRDIEGNTGPTANTKITEIGRWNPVTQTVEVYRWTTTGWTGNNFNVNSGDGIYFKIVATFSWQPKLVTPEVP